MQLIQRNDPETPSLSMFTDLAGKHITNALGDKDESGTNNLKKVRNFAFLKMFYETFHNHDDYVDALKEPEVRQERADNELEDELNTSGIVSFGALVTGIQEPDPEYEGQRCFNEDSSDDEAG